LERGYAIARHLGTGKVVRSVAQVVAGDRLEVRVSDGQLESRVEQT
jgi:exonuclease VII large subunit